jgi:hypothetical protein
MAENRPLLFTADGDATITPSSTQAFRIRAIGTDKGSQLTPSISGNDVGPIISRIAALHDDGTNELGPLELGDLYYYVPPEEPLSFDGASGDDVVVIGERIDGVPAGTKFVSSADETRWNNQGERHYTYVTGSLDITSDIADGQEDTVFTLTPATDERYQFTGVQYMDRTAGSWTEDEGTVNVFWNLDGQRIPSQFNDDRTFGVDYRYMDGPPDDSLEQTPFIYDRYLPQELQDSGMSISEVGGGHNAFAGVQDLVVTGDQTLQVRTRNVSGGTLTEGSTTTWEYTALVRFEESI